MLDRKERACVLLALLVLCDMHSHELYLFVCLFVCTVYLLNKMMVLWSAHKHNVRPWLQLRQEHFDPCAKGKYRVAEQGSMATLETAFCCSIRDLVGGTGIGDELLHTFLLYTWGYAC